MQPAVLLCAAEGFALNLGLLLALGAQASFVLRQGMARRHVAPVVAVCCLCDAVLIGLGTAGAGAVALGDTPGRVLALGGAAFMAVYGARALRAAWRAVRADPASAPAAVATAERRLSTAVLATLAVTLLNPHVYLEIFVILGGAAARHAPAARPWFALGAVAASLVWFVALGRGGALLAAPLGRPRVRAALDLLVGAVMWRGAAGLVAWA
jgi:L-lysine exporter family protein LysE/ArgO